MIRLLFSWSLGYIVAAVATMDLRVAVHRGRAYSTRKRLLHTVHRDQSLHYLWHGNSGFLRARNRNGLSLLAYMARDGEASKGFAQFASGQAGCQQA